MPQEARLLEKANEWLKAAETCKQLHSLTQEHGERAEILKEIGFCLRRAATQSSSLADFQKTAQEAQEFYLQASREFESVPEGQGEASHCQGAGLICASFGVMDPLERKRILNEARVKQLEAFRIFTREQNIAGASASCISLLESTVDLSDIEADTETKRALIEEGFEAWEALDVSKIGAEDDILAMLYSRSAQLMHRAALILPDAGRRKICAGTSIEHGRLGLKLAQASGDHYVIAFANVVLAWAYNDLTADVWALSGVDNARDGLMHASMAGDHWLKSFAYSFLCMVSYWRMSEEEDQERMMVYSNECEEQAWKGVQEATAVNFASAAAISYLHLAENYGHLAMLETDDRKRLEGLKKAVQMGRKAVEQVRLGGSDYATSWSLHSLSKALYYLAMRIEDPSTKASVLEEALETRKQNIEKYVHGNPFDHWDRGVGYSYLALVLAELAEVDPQGSFQLLKDAEHSMEKCIELCREHLSLVSPEETVSPYWGPLASYLSWYGDILSRLHDRNRQAELLERASYAFDEAASFYDRVGALGSGARMRWQVARVLEDGGELSKAADTYEKACKSFELAAGKTPTLTQVYLEYSSLMKAQSHSENARLADREGENDRAAQFFLKASKLLETSSRWQTLAPFYKALAQVEYAEASSKKEELERASEQFREARNMLLEVKRTLQESLRSTKSDDELTIIRHMIDDVELRSDYCLARLGFQEGKLLTRKFTRSRGLAKFEKARTLFEELSCGSEVSEEERDQLQMLAMSCRAEEMLARGDETADPNAYAEASQIFQAIRERSRTKNVRTLTQGHLSYCKALEAGAKYMAGLDPRFFDEAKMHLERAIEAYDEAGSKAASTWAEATRMCLDAHAYLDRAETALDVDDKLRFYGLAEKCLGEAAKLYENVGYQNKKQQVIESLERVRKHRRFAISLRSVLASAPTSPPVEVSVAAFHEVGAAPSPKELERPNVQGRVIVPSEAETGKRLEVQFDLVNVGSASALLVKLEKAVPKTWKAVLSSNRYQLVDGSLNLRARKLDPLEIETISLVAETNEAGSFEIGPKLVFIDDLAQLRTCNLDAACVAVLAPLALDLERPASEKIFNSLLEAFVKDYRDRKIFIDMAGWRSMIEIARAAKVPRSALYGAGGGRGPALSELQRKRLAEVRIFPGQRGRGGQIIKARVHPANLQVQAHLRQAGVKIPEK